MKLLNFTIQVLFLTSVLTVVTVSFAGQEYMLNMPKISPKAIYEVKDPAALQAESGFGNEAPSIKMMNLMMVEGSGMEGMDMSQMKMAQNEITKPVKMSSQYVVIVDPKSQDAHVGNHTISFKIKDTQKNKPAAGLKLKAQVSMTSMDMGTEEPEVKETSPGVYAIKAGFSMQGPWAVKLIFTNGESQIINFEVKKK